jgi:hypothetical protein
MSKKDFDLADAFDVYLDRRNLKEAKPISNKEVKDVRLEKTELDK